MHDEIGEALRYLGVTRPDEGMLRAMRETARELDMLERPRWVWRVFPLAREGDSFSLVGAEIVLRGVTARRMLESCRHAVLLACTLGVGFDRLLRVWQCRDMARAVMLDACGSARVESACDRAEEEIAAAHPALYLTDRFSPGYGDLPLSLQPGMLAALNAYRTVGITLTDSLLMNPTKSVTAVIGLSDEAQRARIRGCAYCRMAQDCAFRKRGERCDA